MRTAVVVNLSNAVQFLRNNKFIVVSIWKRVYISSDNYYYRISCTPVNTLATVYTSSYMICMYVYINICIYIGKRAQRDHRDHMYKCLILCCIIRTRLCGVIRFQTTVFIFTILAQINYYILHFHVLSLQHAGLETRPAAITAFQTFFSLSTAK